ncbi:hypothetical protein HYT23_06530 [Candidatus Pacearchaeota archaeon]|nr:hypothetical protein [Candidatus Pacearchaeota archaeon]
MKKRPPSRLFLLFLILSLEISFVSAAANTYTVKQSEATLNVQGFNAGNAFDFSFGDSVNLFSGNLVITATDIYLPGRNGLDVALTRQYNSNIFLHRNQCNTLNDPTRGESGGNGGSAICSRNALTHSTACQNCDVPSSVSGIHTPNQQCCGKDTLASSWKRAKLLGRGWDMDYGKVKDPTPLFFQDLRRYVDFPTGIPMQGINSLSLVLQNSESEVVLPSKFKLGDIENYPFSWGTNLWSGMYGDIFYAPDTGEWYNPATQRPMIYALAEGSLTEPAYAIYTGYIAGSSSPLTLIYSRDPSRGNNGIGTMIPPEKTWPIAATLTSNGLLYEFNKIVRFCESYDDLDYLPGGDQESQRCKPQSYYSNPDNPYTWAENPYAGLYLSKIYDKAGNFISVKYFSEGYDSQNVNANVVSEESSPYISRITDTFGRDINFMTSGLDINAKLDWINYPNYRGDLMYVDYIYNSFQEGTAPAYTLLKEIHIKDSSLNDVLPPTKYTYDSNTQELTGITYPNGLSVSYVYADVDFLTINLNEYSVDPGIESAYFDLNGRMTKHRAVIQRRVSVPEENGGQPYIWSYAYSTEGFPGSDYPLSVTTVTDPLGNKVVHKFIPPTARMSYLNAGSDVNYYDWSSDYECGVVCNAARTECYTDTCRSL